MRIILGNKNTTGKRTLSIPKGVGKGQGPIILALFPLRNIIRFIASYNPVYYIYVKKKKKSIFKPHCLRENSANQYEIILIKDCQG